MSGEMEIPDHPDSPTADSPAMEGIRADPKPGAESHPLVDDDGEAMEIVGTIRPSWASRSTFKWISAGLLVVVVALSAVLVATKRGSFGGSSNNGECPSLHFYSKLLDKAAKGENLCDDFYQELGRECTCKNPVVPAAPHKPEYLQAWMVPFERNRGLVKSNEKELDVVFLGDSITEHWIGEHFGSAEVAWNDNYEVFRNLFVKDTGGDVDGLPLGIYGDRCPNLLYRIQNGENPELLNPKVWWLLIGTNDMADDFCSAEAVVSGNIKIVQELRERSPDSKVVINSILPRHPLMFEETVEKINHLLSCYSQQVDNVDFFDATDIFLQEDNTIDPEMMPDYMHPSGLGSRIWGLNILLELI